MAGGEIDWMGRRRFAARRWGVDHGNDVEGHRSWADFIGCDGEGGGFAVAGGDLAAVLQQDQAPAPFMEASM